jgi:hypothetical protein
MRAETFKLSVTYDQIMRLVKQLPAKEKVKLGREIAREVLDAKFVKLLSSFKTDEISEELINEEVEKVRTELYAKKKRK